MTSLHYRSASATDRRSTHLPNGSSRVNSARARDYERLSVRDSGSPSVADGYTEQPESAHKHSKSENRFSGVERRKEKTTITTTDTVYTRRSPKKEGGNPENKQRSTASPVPKRPAKEEESGKHHCFQAKYYDILTIVPSTMDSISFIDPSLVRPSCDSNYCASFVSKRPCRP